MKGKIDILIDKFRDPEHEHLFMLAWWEVIKRVYKIRSELGDLAVIEKVVLNCRHIEHLDNISMLRVTVSAALAANVACRTGSEKAAIMTIFEEVVKAAYKDDDHLKSELCREMITIVVGVETLEAASVMLELAIENKMKDRKN